MSNLELYQGDCLEVMPTLDGPVDMILADLPYGTTACKWDTVIPFAPLWEQYKRLIKRNGAIVLFGSQPFTSALVMSNPAMFRYALVWEKSRVGLFAQAPYRFLSTHEDVLVFSHATCAHNSNPRLQYNPQGVLSVSKRCVDKKGGDNAFRPNRQHRGEYTQRATNYPRSILRFASEFNTAHETQKPVALMGYLIRTYTNEGETVLDNTMGSGTTGVACVNTDRNFIGIERDPAYFAIAQKRIQEAQSKARQLEFIA